MSRRPRGLRPEEERLWRQVARTATPLASGRSTLPREDPPGFAPEPARTETSAFSIAPFRIGERAAPLHGMPPPERSAPRMDSKTHARARRGKLAPEARIDLHGMTAAAAEAALAGFLLRAHAEDRRLVLVITGKGRSSDPGDAVPVRGGVLRRHLPHWLARPPLSAIVLDTLPAHQRHGGAGAFYVYLARRRIAPDRP